MKQTEPKRLYQSVAAQILALIQQEKLGPGTRLPPERELAQTLGVSRPSLREALIALEIGGQVEIRMGSGVYVQDASTVSESAAIPSLGESPSELMQARAVLEGDVITLATGRLTAATLDKLQRTIDRMKKLASSGKSPTDADRQFHMLIAETAGNSVLSRFVAELFDSRHDPLAMAIRDHAEGESSWHAAVHERTCGRRKNAGSQAPFSKTPRSKPPCLMGGPPVAAQPCRGALRQPRPHQSGLTKYLPTTP